MTTRDGSVWTVTVNGSTTYQYGQGTGTLADVKDGQTVRVQGTATADNQITALNVRVAGDRAVGTVTAKTADTITIKRRDGTSLTIHVDADTTYRVAGVEDADLGDITVDMAIGVSGRARADGSIDADAVAAGKLRGFGRGARWRPRRRRPGPGLASSCRRPGRTPTSTGGRRRPDRLSGTLASRGTRRISHRREYEGPARIPAGTGRSVGDMELVVAFVSALIGLSVAFFLSISFYDLLPEPWVSLGRLRRRSVFDLAGGRQALIPRRIQQTPLD